MNSTRLLVSATLAVTFFQTVACADTVDVGVLSFDTFVPGGDSPGINAFDLANFTGMFNLPPDFPVANDLVFSAATLTLTLSDNSEEVFSLGAIAPGFLLDGNGNPLVQVPGNLLFTSAEFTTILAPLTFLLSDGSSFTADSAAIDITLWPSVGTTLTPDIDQAIIFVTASTPEPATKVLTATAFLMAIFGLVRHRKESI